MTFGYPPRTKPAAPVPATLDALQEKLDTRYANTSALDSKANASSLAAKLDKTEAATTYAPRTPAPTTAATTGVFDPRTSVYNLKPKHLRRTRAALGRARAGTGSCKIATMGDSTTGGVGAGTISVNDWPARFVSMLSNAGYPLSGSGVVSGWKASAADSRWTIPAAWGALSGYSNLITNSTTADALVFTSTNTATTAAVYYSNGGGAFTVSIDGGAPVAVTPPGGSSMATYLVSGLANTTHTISIARTSGNVQIFGAEVGNGNGVRLWNAGIGGEKINPGALPAGWFVQESILSSTSGFNADLVFLMMETNDAGTTPVATYKTSMQNVITTIRNNGSDLVLVTSVPSSNVDFTNYTKVLYELADTNDLPLIDLQDKMGTYALTNGYGLMSDGLHPNAAGYAEVARDIYNALAL